MSDPKPSEASEPKIYRPAEAEAHRELSQQVFTARLAAIVEKLHPGTLDALGAPWVPLLEPDPNPAAVGAIEELKAEVNRHLRGLVETAKRHQQLL